MITEEEYKWADEYINDIKQIIIDHSHSNIPIGYIEGLKKYEGLNCNCNAGIFNTTSRLYNKYLEYKANIKENNNGKTETENKSKAKPTRKSTKVNKGK